MSLQDPVSVFNEELAAKLAAELMKEARRSGLTAFAVLINGPQGQLWIYRAMGDVDTPGGPHRPVPSGSLPIEYHNGPTATMLVWDLEQLAGRPVWSIVAGSHTRKAGELLGYISVVGPWNPSHVDAQQADIPAARTPCISASA